MSFHIGVNVLLEQDGKVLLGKRLKKAGYGSWGLPGGHLEEGESFVAAARRELMEETGLVLDELEFINIANSPQQTAHYIQINFVCRKWHGNLENKEPDICEQWEWFPIHELPNPMFEGHKDIIPAYLARTLMADV